MISVSDKTGIVEFAKGIAGLGVEILSTDGTGRMLREAGIEIMDVSDYTGFPEMLDGRLKTLHPKVHGGLLGKRDNPAHVEAMKNYGIKNIDMVVVNLYPFEATVAKPDCTFEDAVEKIDIGGPTMLRSAAKNHADVTVLTDPRDYEFVLGEMSLNNGCVSRDLRMRLFINAFRRTAEYDTAISEHFESLYLSE